MLWGTRATPARRLFPLQVANSDCRALQLVLVISRGERLGVKDWHLIASAYFGITTDRKPCVAFQSTLNSRRFRRSDAFSKVPYIIMIFARPKMEHTNHLRICIGKGTAAKLAFCCSPFHCYYILLFR